MVLLRIASIPLFFWCTNPHNPHEFGYPVGSVCRENHSFPPVKRHGAGSSPAPWRLGSKILFPAHSVSLWSSSESLAFIHSLSVSTRMSLGLCAEGKIGSPLPHTTPVPVNRKGIREFVLIILLFSLTNPSSEFAGEGCIAFWKIKFRHEKIIFFFQIFFS